MLRILQMITAIENYLSTADADQLDFITELVALRRRQLNSLAALQHLASTSSTSLADSLLGSKVFTLYNLQPGNYTLPTAWVVAFERTFGLAPSSNVNIDGVSNLPDGKTVQFVLRSSGQLKAAFLNAERISALQSHYNEYIASHATVPTASSSSSATPTANQRTRDAQKLLQELGLL